MNKINRKHRFINSKKIDKDDGSTPLDGRLERFAALYAKHPNGIQAYKQAGYTGSQPAQASCHLKKQENVAARIMFLQRELAEQVKIDSHWVLQRLIDLADKPGAKHQDLNRTLELIGRHMSMFVDRVKHEGMPKRIVIKNEDGKVVDELGSNK